MRGRRSLRLIGTTLLVTVATFGAEAPAAHAAGTELAGTVECLSGQAVQGVWVEAAEGGSRWAEWFAIPGHPRAAFYRASGIGAGWVKLHVGCGRYGSAWRTNARSGWAAKVKGANFTINAHCNDHAPGIIENACSAPPNGNRNRATGATGDGGWCTYGADVKWKAATGYWPGLRGHANARDDNARTDGWRVTSFPSRRAAFVRESGGGGFGHTGWVNDLRLDPNGTTVWLNITDMNGNNVLWQWSTRDIAWTPDKINDYSFIQTYR